MARPRMLVVFASAAATVVVAFGIAVAVGEWWLLPVALVVHFLATVIVMGVIGRRVLEDRDKPDPVTDARLQEERAEEQAAPERDEREKGVFGI